MRLRRGQRQRGQEPRGPHRQPVPASSPRVDAECLRKWTGRRGRRGARPATVSGWSVREAAARPGWNAARVTGPALGRRFSPRRAYRRLEQRQRPQHLRSSHQAVALHATLARSVNELARRTSSRIYFQRALCEGDDFAPRRGVATSREACSACSARRGPTMVSRVRATVGDHRTMWRPPPPRPRRRP